MTISALLPKQHSPDVAGDWIVLGADDADHADQLAAAAREVVRVREVRGDGASVHVRVPDGPAMVSVLLYGLAAAGLRPRSTDVRRPGRVLRRPAA